MKNRGAGFLFLSILTSLQVNAQVIQRESTQEVLKVTKEQGVPQNIARYASQVNVLQIGQENQAYLSTVADYDKQTVYQDGHRNFIDSKLSGKTVQQDVLQRGDDNSYRIDAHDKNANHNLRVLQDGHRQHLMIEGSNTMSQGMQVISKSVDQTIIIRNYK